MLAAADHVFSRVRAINPGVRMIVVSSGAFVVTSRLYGEQGSETGALDFLLYGLVGLVPAMMCSWLLNEASNDRMQNGGSAVRVQRSAV